MLETKFVGKGEVLLLAGGGKVYTDIAARFVRSERDLEDIVASPYSKKIVENILSSGHKAALEFDFFIFAVQGYSRVTETQLVRKRLASYLIKSGRQELNGARKFSVVVPNKQVLGHGCWVRRSDDDKSYIRADQEHPGAFFVDGQDLLDLTDIWYEEGVESCIPEENLRYLKPQATEFKGIIGMNAHALLDWFSIRCCNNAQYEIRDMAGKMLKLCKEVAPDLFANAGPNCVQLGYCPENDRQCQAFKNSIHTLDEMREILKQNKKN